MLSNFFCFVLSKDPITGPCSDLIEGVQFNECRILLCFVCCTPKRGSAISQAAGYGVMLGLTLLYIPVSGINKETWRGKNNSTLCNIHIFNIAFVSYIKFRN